MLNKTNFRDLNRRQTKGFVLFGSGNIAKKTILKLQGLNVKFIVDNSKNLQGTDFLNLNVKSPNQLTKGYTIIICSTAIKEISQQLNEMGLEPELDYVISPVLNDLLAIEELEKLNSTIYFTSGSVPTENFGGGLYKMTVNEENTKTTRIYAGPCYGLIKIKNKLIFVDTDSGIKSYSISSGKIEHLANTPKGSRAHGISYNNENKMYYLTCSYLDGVIEYDQNFDEKRRFSLSHKFIHNSEPMHHCNDNLSIGKSLYVSMFSSTGNWKKEVFDGCIAEFDLSSGERKTDIKTNLFMPHNILSINGALHVLDSLPGHLRAYNFEVQGTFPAFTRGLAYDNGLYYIGQSKNRNFSKAVGKSNNISIDCGIIVWHPEKKVSRFLPISIKIGEVHSIVL